MNNIIVIDIGTYLTKVLEAEHSKDGLKVLALESFKTPGNDKDEIDETVFFQELFKIVSLEKLKSSRIGISISPFCFNFSIFDLIKLPRSELNSVALREARRKIIPNPSEQDITKYLVLKQTKHAGQASLTIIAGSAKKELIDKYFSLFQNQGVQLEFISSTPLNSFAYFKEYFPRKTENWVIIDVGFKSTTVAAFLADDLVLIRDIAFGSSDFIRAIAESLSLDQKQASKIFLESDSSNKTVLESWNYLLVEIRRSFAFYKQITNGKNVGSVLFSGGVLSNKSAIEFLRKNMAGKIIIFEAKNLKRISSEQSLADKISVSPTLFSNVLGLLLAMTSKGPSLNFLPSAVIQERKIGKVKLFSQIGLFIFLGILSISFCSLSLKTVLLKKHLFDLRRNFSEAKYQKVNKESGKISLRLRQINSQKEVIESLEKFNLPWQEVFAVVSDSIPADAFLEILEIGFDSSGQSSGRKRARAGSKAPGIKLSGSILESFEAAKNQLKIFAETLEASELFSEVTLEDIILEEIVLKSGTDYTRLTEVKERDFKIQAALNIK
jgi:Tfp pilus assembly PilM family ATPase